MHTRFVRLCRALAAALALAGPFIAPGPALARRGGALPPAGCLGPASRTWLNLTVANVRSARGTITITLYPDKAGRFLVEPGSLYVVRAPAAEGTTRACLFLPHAGTYALAVYHDEDASGDLTRRGPLGIPVEGFGFSNNPPLYASLPPFRDVRLHVARPNLGTTVVLVYP